MCIFTGKIEEVSETRIFARREAYRQAIVYEMFLSSKIDTAMVLPIPVSKENASNKVEFIDLSKYEDFFDDIEFLFPKNRSRSLSLVASAGPILEVQQVGAFEASFVPNQTDFIHLDPRFKLNDNILNKLPDYKDYGFVVFKLRKGESQVHPMAFWFHTSTKEKLYFPTVHVHNEQVPQFEDFSHTIYAQGNLNHTSKLTKSKLMANSNLLQSISNKSSGIVEAKSEVYKKTIVGKHPNTDTWLD